jgi:hypothetical protein
MLRTLIALSLPFLLVACTGGRPKERINPPTVSIQEVRIDDGRCELRLRIQNHSTVGMRFDTVSFERFDLDGRALAPLSMTPDLDVAPYTGEPFRHDVDCPDMTDGATELVYRLAGRITASEPGRRNFEFNHRSRLLPVPGLPGVYR